MQLQPLCIFSSDIVSKVPQPPAPAWPSQGTKDSLNVRSTVRVCTLLVPWPWFCWAARHNKATSHSPPDQWLFSISTSILILIDVWRRRLCIYWEFYQQTWSPSKIGKLTLHAKIFTDVQILEDRCSVNFFRCPWILYCSQYQCRDWGPLHLFQAKCAV